jgi:coniferyl-aldehyde dehydrogenase
MMQSSADVGSMQNQTTAVCAMQEAFQAQRLSFCASPAATYEQRIALIDKLRRTILENAESIQASISQDFGHRSAAETEMLEIIPLLNSIRHTRSNLAAWMRPERRSVDIAFQPGSAWIRREPLGVVGIMAPWNYPLLLTISPLVDAIAAGNRAMIKPSELTPSLSIRLHEIIAQTFDPTEITVIPGGPELARQFARLPFDHLLFTGSTSVGREVMKSAAENLTPVTLELGGKSPAIVCPDYPLQKAARSIAFGKFLNAGQTCIAPDYVLVPTEHCERFAEEVIAQAKRSYPSAQGNPDYSDIINDRHRTRLLNAMAEAKAGGARIVSSDDESGEGVIAPTVVLNAPNDCSLLQEEIFGPILPVVAYRNLEEGFAFIRSRPKPLALYCFSNDKGTQEKVLAGATSGGVTINGTLLHIAQDGLPFGGVGTSGMGAYHGRDGFQRFSHTRSVYKVGMINVFERLGPPWGPAAKRVAAILKRL